MPKIYAPAAALFWLSTAKKQMLDENEFVCIGVALIGNFAHCVDTQITHC